ncbi:MAG: hypothetical protein H7248_09780 [Microbacteriaceae bacterium]|nr:hypothetical protein [Microbacteriaceae bacterium]
MLLRVDAPPAQRLLERTLASAAILVVALTVVIGGKAGTAQAAGLSNASLGMSTNQSGATNVTYTAQFTTASTAVISRFTFDHNTPQPALGIGTAYGLGAGTISDTAGTISYTLNAPTVVAANTPVYLEFTGMVNGTDPQTVTFTTWMGATPPVVVDTVGSIPLVTGSSDTTVTVQVGRTLAFTSDTPAYTLLMDPSLPALADVSKTVNLTIRTNTGEGYAVSMKNIGLKTSGFGAASHSILASGNSSVGAFAATANRFGVHATATTTKSRAALNAAYAGANISGYSPAGATVMTATEATGNTADTIALTNRVKIDYSTPAGTYTDTITYTASPAY